MIAALLGVLACGEALPPPPAAQVQLSVDPELVDFGAIAPGEAAYQVVEIRNEGAGEVTLGSAGLAGGAEVFVNAGGNPALSPGETQRYFLAWTPAALGELDDALEIQVEGGGALTVPLTVPLTGEAAGPKPVLEGDGALGEVALGCEAERWLTLSNQGSRDLEVAEITLEGPASLALDVDRAAPLSLAPGEATSLGLRFSPEAAGPLEATLEIRSEGEALAVAVEGEGVSAGEGADTFEVSEQQPITALLAVNGELTPGGEFSDRLIPALPVYFETLLEAGVPFRVALLVAEDGVVVGEIPYVDEGFTAEEAVDALLGMMAGALDYDNDYLFNTLSAGLVENRGWLLGEEPWASSRLNLLAVSNDLEQSAMNYVSFLQSCGELSDDLVMHAVGGPYPEGCEHADPYAGVYEATVETGGVFLSFCEEDWSGHLETLALASLGGGQATFVLSAAPVVSSLAVSVDGAAVAAGWTYSEALGAVVFERALAVGTRVSVGYERAGDCGA